MLSKDNIAKDGKKYVKAAVLKLGVATLFRVAKFENKNLAYNAANKPKINKVTLTILEVRKIFLPS